ncbi:unnamed protein product [Schistocephalus solidus]|uniref:Uncharacterized protein n=1 Tax=Schistocephalus solidus TaxID=70667 RepID=A0A183SEH4_SCHSO|nr:unnamed protein product [Schistocephalus solidus]
MDLRHFIRQSACQTSAVRALLALSLLLAITVTAHLLLALLTQLIIFRLLSRRILAEIVRQQQPMCRAESDQCARGSTYQPINSAAVQTELNTDSFFERLSDVHLTGAYFPNADSKCSSYTPSLLSTSLDNASLIESQSSASTSATGSVLALQRAGDSTQSTESFTLLQPSAYALPLQVHHRSSALSKTDDRLDPMHNLNSTDALLGNLTGSEVSVTPSNPISRELLPDVSKSSPAFQPVSGYDAPSCFFLHRHGFAPQASRSTIEVLRRTYRGTPNEACSYTLRML